MMAAIACSVNRRSTYVRGRADNCPDRSVANDESQAGGAKPCGRYANALAGAREHELDASVVEPDSADGKTLDLGG